jgi:clan AA aspartic protease (TIGR02281 family)
MLALLLILALKPATAETIKLERQGGIYVVPVEVNGRITLNFVLDSGAADVSIPADVVLTLFRTGTLAERDFLEKKTYVLADGSKLPSRRFTLHDLRIGGQVLRNVTASVAPAAGELLLGQSFLSRFSVWAIDNNQHALILGDGANSTPTAGAPATPPVSQPAQPSKANATAPPPSAPAQQPTAQPSPSASEKVTAVTTPSPAAPKTSEVAVASLPPRPTAPPVSHFGPGGEVAFHCPWPGTIARYDTGAVLIYTGQNGLRCSYKDESGKTLEKYAAFGDDAQWIDAGLGKLWPLKVGTEANFSVMSTASIGESKSAMSEHLKVIRRETLTVPAGVFDTVVVQCDETGEIEARSQYNGMRLFWYAPELGLVVKSTVAITSVGAYGTAFGGPLVRGGDYQAVQVTVPPGAAAR